MTSWPRLDQRGLIPLILVLMGKRKGLNQLIVKPHRLARCVIIPATGTRVLSAIAAPLLHPSLFLPDSTYFGFLRKACL